MCIRDRFQTKFLRRLFLLPQKTPNWFLRLESHCKPIEFAFVKNLINFWIKILYLQSNSLIKICYETLKSTSNESRMKYNWYRSLTNLLTKYKCENLLSLEYKTEENLI